MVTVGFWEFTQKSLTKSVVWTIYSWGGTGSRVLSGVFLRHERPHLVLSVGFWCVEEHEIVLDDSSSSVSAAFGVLETNGSQRRIRALERCFVNR